MSYTETTYNHDYNAISPRHQGHGDFSPRADPLGAGSRYYKASKDDYYTRSRANVSPTRHAGEPFYVQPTYHQSPYNSPRQERHQMQAPPDSYRSQNYDSRSPQPYQTSPRNYEPYRHPPKNDPYRHLPPKNDFSANSTTQHDYGDFTVKQTQVNDIRMKDHYGRRQERPYFDERNLPSFYKSPRDRVPPTFQNERPPPPDMDRWERERRMNGERDDFRRQRPPSPKFRDNPLEDMAAGQLKKEMKRIELHKGNFKPYTDHESPRANIARSIEHPIHRYEPLDKTNHPVIDRDIPVEHPIHRFEPLVKTQNPRFDKDIPVEHPVHRFEPLVKTQNPRIDKDIPVEHPVHRFEPLVKTQHPRFDKDIPVEHPVHRFEKLVKTEHPRVDKDIPVEHPVHRFENLVQTNHPHEVAQKLPMHDYHRFEHLVKTDNPERIYPENNIYDKRNAPGGVYLLIRNHDAGFFDVKKAYDSHTGGTPERRLEGVADARHIQVKEGGRGWKRMATVARWEGSFYDQEVNGPVDQMVSLMWFPSVDKAREWVDRDMHFKHSSFPEPYGNVTSVMPSQYPLMYSPKYRVFMLTEFTNITSAEALEKYLYDINEVLKKYDCDPFFINCTPIPVKSTLFHPNSRVVCHRFKSVDEANYLFDGPITHLRKHFAFAEMTTVIFVIGDIHGK